MRYFKCSIGVSQSFPSHASSPINQLSPAKIYYRKMSVAAVVYGIITPQRLIFTSQCLLFNKDTRNQTAWQLHSAAVYSSRTQRILVPKREQSKRRTAHKLGKVSILKCKETTDLEKSMFQVGEVWRKSHVLHRSCQGASRARVLVSYPNQVGNKGRGNLLSTCTKPSITYYITDSVVERLQSNSKILPW